MAITHTKKKEEVSDQGDGGNMTLTDHLKELRNRLIVCAVVMIIAICIFLVFSADIINLLTAIGRNAGYTFITTASSEKMIQYFRLSIMAGIIVTIPLIFYEVYAFAKPGLKKSERFFFGLVMVFGLVLFVIGVLFAYFIAYPTMMNFFATLEGTDYVLTTTSLESYINFTLLVFVIFGCVFEIPLVVTILAKMGIVNADLMKKGRGISIVVIFTIAAIITPPDVVSQCMVALPMCLLYEGSIVLARVFYKPRLDDDDDEDDEGEGSDEAPKAAED